MKLFSIKRLSGLILSAAFVWAFIPGCQKVDDTLGEEFVPNNQEMKLRTATLRGCFETGLFRADSIPTSNLESCVIGATVNRDTFGLREAGMFTQYKWIGAPADTVFGYRPIFDSIQLILSVNNFDGDTTRKQRYEIFEVKDNSFLTQSKDSVFYGSFDIDPYLESEPSFTFDFPDQARGIYTNSSAVTLSPTARGRQLVSRLMLQSGGITKEIFGDQAEWLRQFKGLYIRPAALPADAEGSMVSFKLDESGLVLHGRNRSEIDPALIRDTTAATYYFYYESGDDEYDQYGNQSINTFRHDYTGTLLGEFQFDEHGNGTEPSGALFVEGMSGVVGRITLTESLFEQLEDLLEQEEAASGVRFTDMAFSKATLYFYGREAAPEWQELQLTPSLIDWLDGSLPRLGLFTDYNKQRTIADYNVYYEQQGYALPYGGYLNRSWGCYTMDVKDWLQQQWNDYREWKEGKREERPVPTVYLGPEAGSANTSGYASVQGMDGGQNGVPMKFELAYVMVSPQKE